MNHLFTVIVFNAKTDKKKKSVISANNSGFSVFLSSRE